MPFFSYFLYFCIGTCIPRPCHWLEILIICSLSIERQFSGQVEVLLLITGLGNSSVAKHLKTFLVY
jgi:hypothetical protein